MPWSRSTLSQHVHWWQKRPLLQSRPSRTIHSSAGLLSTMLSRRPPFMTVIRISYVTAPHIIATHHITATNQRILPHTGVASNSLTYHTTWNEGNPISFWEAVQHVQRWNKFLWHFWGITAGVKGIWRRRNLVVIFKHTISQAEILRFFCTDTTRSFGETRIVTRFFELYILCGMKHLLE